MHYRFLVTCNKDEAETSEAARRHVFDTLMAEGFATQEGRWACGPADGFVIGGRWSGELSRHSWAKALYAHMAAVEHREGIQVWGAFYGDPEKTRVQKALEQLLTEAWRNAAPEVYRDIPIDRDTYLEAGYEDDAMILTQELYDALLKPYEGKEMSDAHADLDFDPASPAMVGKKWLVVVD
jgi:hypothetical protein